MNSLFVLTWRGSFRSNFKRRAIYFDREGDYGESMDMTWPKVD